MFICAQDFFYVCIGHLSDRGFCQPDADEAKDMTERKKKEEMDGEIERVKKEYEEKQRIKKEKRKAKAKDKESKSNEDEEDKKDEKAKDDKVCFPQRIHDACSSPYRRSKSSPNQAMTPRPSPLLESTISPSTCSRLYTVTRRLRPHTQTHYRSFYQMRLDKLRNADMAKRNRERLQNPANFPSVPNNLP